MPNALPVIATQFSELQGSISASQHGILAGGTLHAEVIAGGAAGFLSGADKTRLDSLPSGSGTAGQLALWSATSALGKPAGDPYLLTWSEAGSSGRLGINTASPATALHVRTPGTGTTGIALSFIYERDTTGTPAAGFGTSIGLYLKSTTTSATVASGIAWSWLDPTHASRASVLQLGTVRSGGTFAYTLDVSAGSNQATIIARWGWSGQTNDIQRWNNNNDTLTYAAISNIGQLTLKPVDAVTNALTTVATLGHNSSGTPAANFGGAIIGQLQSSTTVDRDAARISWYWSTATDATRTSLVGIGTVISGTLADRVIIGNLSANGFVHIAAGGIGLPNNIAGLFIDRETSDSLGRFYVGRTTEATNTRDVVIGYSSSVLRLSAKGNGIRIIEKNNFPISFYTNDTERMIIRGGGSVIVGNATAALATTATDGFLYIPTCAGTPTGAPTAETGTAPIVYDTSNNILYVYAGGTWRAH